MHKEKELFSRYAVYFRINSLLSPVALTYSLNESGSIFISTYLPDNSVAISEDSIYAFDPVI